MKCSSICKNTFIGYVTAFMFYELMVMFFSVCLFTGVKTGFGTSPATEMSTAGSG